MSDLSKIYAVLKVGPYGPFETVSVSNELPDVTEFEFPVIIMERTEDRVMIGRYRSTITGRFVSRAFALANPDTTYFAKVSRPKWTWKVVGEHMMEVKRP